MLLHGLQGPLEAGAQVFNGFMPASGLGDEDLAAVLSWVRTEFAGGAEEVTPQEVARIREEAKGRVHPWTSEELGP
jgi:mono/diheme cytochrome c family protein